MPVKIVNFNLNGRNIDVMVSPLTTLQTLLRKELNYTATKSGCKQGSCGSCTVLVNSEPMLACLLPVEDVEGQDVLTLEGLTDNGDLHPIQETFFESFAIQCGYCTPGMIMVSKALLDVNSNPNRKEIVEALTGNYCRCTGYEPIIRAVEKSSQRLLGAAEEDGGGSK
jgi:aerobic-type carbon monoxide dehydrogenase small subunit (CoxS/CutS family)